MVDTRQKREEKFYPSLITGSYVTEKGLDNKRRAGMAYRIEDRDENLITKENKYIGAKEIYNKKHAESVALFEGIKQVKQELPVHSTDLRIRTGSTDIVEQLHNEDDDNETGRFVKLVKTELRSFWTWGAKREPEKVSIKIKDMNNYAELSFPTGEQTYD